MEAGRARRGITRGRVDRRRDGVVQYVTPEASTAQVLSIPTLSVTKVGSGATEAVGSDKLRVQGELRCGAMSERNKVAPESLASQSDRARHNRALKTWRGLLSISRRGYDHSYDQNRRP